jgi:hypothetical protein
LPEEMDAIANEVVVACVPVALRKVKFCKVEDPFASKFPTVTKFENVGVPPKVPESEPPPLAFSAPVMVEEPVTASAVVVAPPVSERVSAETSPALSIVKSVDVAVPLVDEPMVKSVVVMGFVEEAAKIEKRPEADEDAIPTLPFARKVVVETPPK